MIQKATSKREDGNPDGSQMDLHDMIIVWEPLEKRGDPGEEGGVHSPHWDYRRWFHFIWGR